MPGIVRLFGPIGEPDLFSEGTVSARQFVGELDLALAENEDGVVVEINSPGGDVYDGLTIYNEIKKHPNVDTLIVGQAASIASIIALAGSRVRMAKGTRLMIHNPWTRTAGDSNSLRKSAEELEKIEAQLIGIYADKTGLPASQLAEMMAVETYMTDDEALFLGFVDEIDGMAQPAVRISAALAYSRVMARALEPNNPNKQTNKTDTMSAELQAQVEQLKADNQAKDALLAELKAELDTIKAQRDAEAKAKAEQEKQEGEAAIQAAVKDRRIKAEDAPLYTEMVSKMGLGHTLKVLAAQRHTVGTLHAQMKEAVLGAGIEGKSFYDLTLTKEGADYLAALKAQDPEAYNKLAKQK